MSINQRSSSHDSRHGGSMGGDHSHDDGLAHNHLWATDPTTRHGSHPHVADAARVQTPSSVRHDDVHFA